MLLFFTQGRDVPARGWLRSVLTGISAFAPYLPVRSSGTMHPDELPVAEPLEQDPEAFVGRFLDGAEAGELGGATMEVLQRGEGLRLRLTPAGQPRSRPYDLIHLGENRFGFGRTMDGVVVEYSADSPTLEFRSPDSNGRYGEIQLAGSRVFSRVDH